MANGLMPLAGLCALYLSCVGCGSDRDSEANFAAGTSTDDSGGGAPAGSGKAGTGGSATAGTSHYGGAPSSAGATSGGTTVSAGSATKPSGGESGGPPPAVDGKSVYALECHGDSKDCNLASVPCFGVGSQTANVAAGWACANRCLSDADCSDAPSGAEAQASCISFTSASHCVLVCRNENQSLACPSGMACYVPAKSPIGYCLWQ
jgi:hypothetical protein